MTFGSTSHGRAGGGLLRALAVLGALSGCAADGADDGNNQSNGGLPLGGSTGGGGGLAGVGAAAGVGGGTAGVGVGTAGASGAGAGASGAPAGGTGGTTALPAGGAGAGGAGGVGGMVAGAGGAAGGGLLGGPGPTLPAIMGECPTFTDGDTISVAGHGSVLILAGPPGMGGPLLFYWHGTGGSATEATRTLPAAVRSEIMAAGGIIASFNGSQSSGTEGDCSGTGAHNMADFKAADQIAACAVMNHGIDPRRIYTTGCSAGGLQSGCMAMQRSSYIAAAAPNSGGIVFAQPWEDEHTPSIFTMHGGSSDMVIVTFSQTSATLDMNAKTHGSFVVNCDHGGGHCRAPAELQSSAWQFMKDHPWGFTPPSPWVAAFPAGTPDYCAIF